MVPFYFITRTGWNAPSILREKKVWTFAASLAASFALVWMGGLTHLIYSSAVGCALEARRKALERNSRRVLGGSCIEPFPPPADTRLTGRVCHCPAGRRAG
jgi:hypothetical protein